MTLTATLRLMTLETVYAKGPSGIGSLGWPQEAPKAPGEVPAAPAWGIPAFKYVLLQVAFLPKGSSA